MLKGKKADFTDVIIIIIIAFFLSIAFVTALFATSKFKEVIQDTLLGDTEQAAGLIAALENMSSNSVQNGFMMIFAFLAIATITSSFLVRVHPVWVWLYILFAGIGIFLAVPIANTYNMFISATAIAEIAGQQVKINYVMQHLVEIMIGIAALCMIVLFAKPRTEGGF